MSDDVNEENVSSDQKKQAVTGHFAEVSEDRFTQVKSAKSKNPLSWARSNDSTTPASAASLKAVHETQYQSYEYAAVSISIEYRHKDDADGLFLAILFQGINYDWPGLEAFELLFIVDDGARIAVTDRSMHQHDYEVMSGEAVKKVEFVQLHMPLSDLMTLIDARKVEYRLSFSKLNIEGVLTENDLINLRGFYNNAFDDEYRLEELYTAVEAESAKSTSAAAKSGGCYIATAVYGNYDHPSVIVLRAFRDDRLAQTMSGRALIKMYYMASPLLASKLKRAPNVSAGARIILDKIIAYISKQNA